MNEDRGLRIEDRNNRILLRFFVFSCILLVLSGCNSRNPSFQGTAPVSNRVVLYCSVDDVYAQPIIRELEKKTGLRIDALYDTEATKTAGLAYRIRAERNRPRGDVFWSSALLQTLLLNREGLLQPYQSPSAHDIPAAFKDPGGAWTGMGVRARIIVYHYKGQTQFYSLQDLKRPLLKSKLGISNPQFGTGSDWVAAMATRWGIPGTLQYFQDLKQNNVQVLPGNSVVAQKVARGDLQVGVTDTDDFEAQRKRGNTIATAQMLRVTHVRPQDTLLVPGSVAMLKGAPHPDAARKLIDALLESQTEKLLIQKMPGVYPLHTSLRDLETEQFPWVTQLKAQTPADTARWPIAWETIRDPLAKILLTD